MLSVGSRDGLKRLGMDMDEVEEGEAPSYYNQHQNLNNVGVDVDEDPDISLSYIEEKIQNVLGHFQKDFEGGVVSAENLGAKFGGYGSFLPTYQRSPSWAHAKSQQEAVNSDSPRKLQLEDRRQSSLAQSSASPSIRPCDASGRTSSMGNSLKSDVYIPPRHAEEPVSKRGVLLKSLNPPDQRNLKVRLKVGPEKLSTKKNVDIYSGLGLVSPSSSSLDDSPSTSEQQCSIVSDPPIESPSSILEIMTSVHSDLLLTPLSEDLICLTDQIKHKVKSESGIENKTGGVESSTVLSNGFHSSTSNQKANEHKILKSSEKYEAVLNKTSYRKNYDDQSDTGCLFKKEHEHDTNALGYEELVSNALKLPLLSSLQDTVDDPAKVMSTPTNFPVIASKEKKQHNESLQNIGIIEKQRGRTGSSSKVAINKKGRTVDIPYAQQDVFKTGNDQFKQQVAQKGAQDSEEYLNPAPENSSTGGKKKPKRAQNATAQYPHVRDNQSVADFSVTSKREKGSRANGILSKTDSHDPHQRELKKPGDMYKHFFGDIEFEEDDNDSISGEMALKDSQQVGNTGLNERGSVSIEKFDVKNSGKPRQPEGYSRAMPGSEHPMATDNPLVNEEWVLCDKCGRWRLLPLGTNPDSLPDKWTCRMLTWLPGMNRCNVHEDETTNALRAIYHPAPVPAAFPSSVQVISGDARNSEAPQNVAGQNEKIGWKKKHGSVSTSYSTDIDGTTRSSNSRKKNLPASGKNGNLSRVNPYPVQETREYQQTQLTKSDVVNKLNDDKKDGKLSLAKKGINLKIRSQRESDMGDSRATKRIKVEEFRDDENWASDNGRGYNSDLAINSSRNGRVKYTNHTDPRGDPKESTVALVAQEMPAPGENLLCSSKSDDKKRKRKENRDSRISAMPHSNSAMCETGHQKEKKARITNSRAANSSSSKVSGSHKNKTSTDDVKGSPVESVTSSPLRLPNKLDKVKSTRRTLLGKDDIHDSGSFTLASSRKFPGIEGDEGSGRIGVVEKYSAPPANYLGTSASAKRSSDQCQVEDMILNDKKLQNNGSHSKKSGKWPSSHSKDKSHPSDFDIHTDKLKASDTSFSQDNSNVRRSKFDEKSGTPVKAEKFLLKKEATAQGTSVENSKGQRQDVTKSQDKKHKLDKEKELNSEKLPKKSNQVDAKKSHSLPPLARSQVETVLESGSKKQNRIKITANDALDNGHDLKVTNSNTSQTQNGHPIPSRQPSPLPRESSSHAASVLKEAKDLKHLADRLRNNGSSDSIGLYFQAVLKFLHGASLLESGSSEGTKQNDVAHAMHIYSSTAKLCEYCAHEYEKSKDMAAAALAYKCTEVAHMRVVYSSHTSAIRDRNELQTALQVVPPGESPSSSASDVDNLNHQPITDKGPLAKVLGSPQVSGSHIISLRNRAGFLRLLNFAQEVNFAMEAAKKSRIAYTAASSKFGEEPQREGVDSLKEVLDFSFQDVEGLLRLVRIAMEVIGR